MEAAENLAKSRLGRISRRDWGRIAAAAAAGFAVGSVRAAGTKRPLVLRYILASSLYGRMRLEEIVPEVRKTGTQLLDVWPEVHANQREQMEALGHERFGEMLARHGVRLGMTTRYDLGPLRLADELAVVAKLGGSLVVTGSEGPKNLSGAKCKEAVREFVARMAPQVAAAERHGVTIGIENHLNALVYTPDSLRHLAELARSPRLGIALAPYHLPQDPELVAKLIEDLGPKLVHFYAWQEGQGCFRKLPKEQELEQMPGRGRLDFKPIVAALAKIGYSGWTEVFMHPVPRGIPILDTAAAVTDEVNRARRYLDRIVEQV